MSRFGSFWCSNNSFSRRDFIKLCGLGFANLIFPRSVFAERLRESQTNPLLGRVTLANHGLFEEPDETSSLVQHLAMDSLWEITGVTVAEDDEKTNRIWYELDGRGYAHSGRIQPVHKQINQPANFIPEDGCLGEITMPFVDSYSRIDKNRFIVYRFYYGATFWILKRLVDEEGSVWYQLLDDRYYRVFYIPAYYMRIVTESELSPLSADVPPDKKSIYVDLETQTLTAYEGEQAVFMSRISSGVRLSEGGFATPKGYYRTTRKRPCRHMANGPSAYGSGFDLPGVPWVSYFTSDGVALHGAYWHNNFGVPHSHGCVNMTPQAAKWIYRWTTPSVPPDRYYYSEDNGTRVIVQ